MLFKDRLKIARERKSISQSELAKLSGLHPSSISHFENGKRDPNIKNIKKLSLALMCSSDFLLGITIDDAEMELSDLKFKIRTIIDILK